MEELTQNREEFLNARRKFKEQLETSMLEKFSKIKLKELRFDCYTGDPREIILEKAEERIIDVLIIGHRDLGVLQRLMLGSVSDYLVKNAKCSVLVC